jgi:hypothetical protein
MSAVAILVAVGVMVAAVVFVVGAARAIKTLDN